MYKIIFLFGICGCILSSCNRQKLAPQYLTNITVIRDLNKPNVILSKDTLLNTPSFPKDSTLLPAVPAEKKTYYIIVGSYSYTERNQAEKFTEKLKTEGYPACLLETNNRLRISIDNFATEQEAIRQRKKYSDLIKREDIWIYKMPN